LLISSTWGFEELKKPNYGEAENVAALCFEGIDDRFT